MALVNAWAVASFVRSHAADAMPVLFSVSRPVDARSRRLLKPWRLSGVIWGGDARPPAITPDFIAANRSASEPTCRYVTSRSGSRPRYRSATRVPTSDDEPK